MDGDGQYIAAQFIGSALGGFATLAVAGHDTLAKAGYGQPVLGAGTGMGAGILGEAIATFFLLLVVLKVAARQANPMGGFIVGLTVALNILALGGQTGGAQNPVRAFGAVVVSGNCGGCSPVLLEDARTSAAAE